MAIAFARMDIHGRSKGHSAVHGAAYRAGSKLYDERTGKTHDYTHRKDVKYHAILLPYGAGIQFQDQATLWNSAEHAEKRKDAQLAKDLKLALPRDVSPEHHIALARHFAYEHFVAHGVAADIAIHDNGDGNPHAHIYITLRRIKGSAFDRLKALDLNPTFAKSAGKRGFITEQDYWGDQWRHAQNTFFREQGLTYRVDPNHLITQRHEGHVSQAESHYIKEENQLKKAATLEIALTHPANLLNQLGSTYAVFSARDIQAFVFKSLPKTVKKTNDDDDASDGHDGGQTQLFATIMQSLLSHRDLIHLGLGEDGRERYTTRANYRREAKLLDDARALQKHATHAVKRRVLRQALKAHALNAEQRHALHYLVQNKDITCLVGRAGTGKSSYVLKAAHAVWTQSGYRVRGMAVSGVATDGLENASGIPSDILYSVRAHLLNQTYSLGANDILVMDEAGMTDLTDMAVIVDAVKQAGAKLVLVGDHAQLQPVGPGAPFRALLNYLGFAELNAIQRQTGPGDRRASVLLSQGKTERALDHYASNGRVTLEATDTFAMDALFQQWQHNLTPQTLTKTIILAHRNQDVDVLNQRARHCLAEQGLMSSAHTITTVRGKMALARGERVLFLKNDRTLGVHNGNFGTVSAINASSLSVRLDNGNIVRFSPKNYQHFTYGYAATVHKTQGATFDNVYVYAGGNGWDRFLTYVALTRHRLRVAIFASQETHATLNKLKYHLSRDSIRDAVIDWPVSYALRRGFDPGRVLGRFIQHTAGLKTTIHDKWLWLTNYERYLLDKEHRSTWQRTRQRRRDARRVATFVDLHREMGAKWASLRSALDDEQPLSEHSDYVDTVERWLKKNQMAHAIMQEYDRYAIALAHNRIDPSQMADMVNAHQCAERAKHYLAAYQQRHRINHDRRRLAEQIYPTIKAHYTALCYFAHTASVDKNIMLAQLRRDYEIAALQRYLLTADPLHRHAAHLVKQYAERDRDLRARWRLVYANGGFENRTHAQHASNHASAVLRDRLGYRIALLLEQAQPALTIFAIEPAVIADAKARYLARERVKSFRPADDISALTLAATIKADLKRHLPYLNEFNIDFSSVNLGNWHYQRRLAISRLSAEDKARVRLLERYQQLTRQTAHAWAKAHAADHKTQTIQRKAAKIALSQQFSLQRDALAAQIQATSELFSAAFNIVNINNETLAEHAARYRRHEFVLRYRDETRLLFRAKMASYLQLDLKAYYGSLCAAGIDMATLRREARHHDYLIQLDRLPPEQRLTYRTLERYTLKRQAAGRAWGEVRTAKQQSINATSLAHLTGCAQHISVQRNRLAHRLLTDLKLTADNALLAAFHLDYRALQKAANDYHHWQTVYQYVTTHNIRQRDRLAQTILATKATHHYVYQYQLDWSLLYTLARNAERRQHLAQLNKTERAHWAQVDQYDQARLSAAKAWSQLYNARDKGNVIPDARLQFCYQLTRTRNQHAYTIACEPSLYTPYLQKTRITLDALKKHATAHSRQLQRDNKRLSPTKSHTIPTPRTTIARTPRMRSANVKQDPRYADIQAALMAMGPDFYTRVFGDEGKRAGTHMRYGNKGSFSVTLQGERTGQWYSFELGQGGGPIQLLMNNEYGWGLSYEEALATGARLAGLYYRDHRLALPSPRRQPAPSVAKQSRDDVRNKAKKIAASRYYYENGQPVTGTLGERYLRQTRGITHGDLSEFRFHSRIRDTRVLSANEKPLISYHPGLVVAGRNQRGEIVCSQTILLCPNTANKVAKTDVGAVKRTRGELKGSAALIHRGTTSEVILAEGPETAASLIAAAPDAWIYVTLGNVSNAKHLAWLAKQHHTSQLIFAADHDGVTHNINALQTVAEHLKTTHAIDCYIAQPTLPDQTKYDFNDVLQQSGLDAVKTQLAHRKRITVKDRAAIVDEKTLITQLDTVLGEKLTHTTKTARSRPSEVMQSTTSSLAKQLDNTALEWKKLATLTHKDATWLLKYRDLALKETDPIARDRIYQSMQKHIVALGEDKIAMESITTTMPAFACVIHELNTTKSAQTLAPCDWFETQLTAEWEALRHIDNKHVQWLVKFYDLGKAKTEPKQRDKANQTITQHILPLAQQTKVLDTLQQGAPRLAKNMRTIIKHHRYQQRGMERDDH